MKIGVLTGGGDVPGLNSAIKALTLAALDAGHEMVGIRRGWGGLVGAIPSADVDNSTFLMPLTAETVRKIDRTGGTFLHSSRTNPSNVSEKGLPAHLAVPGQTFPADVTPYVLEVLAHFGIDALVAIGGDDTLSYAARLDREGFPTVAIPKTMDNDVPGTEYCIGFGTTISRSVDLVNDLRTSVGSHERIAVVELFGRNAGWTSLFTALLADADRCLIPEVPFDVVKLSGLLMEDKKANPSNYAMVVVSEGAVLQGGEIVESGEADAYGHKKLGGIGDITAAQIKRITGQNMIIQPLRYMVRCGKPSALDLMVGKVYGNMAFDLVAAGQHGDMVAVKDGCYTTEPIQTVVSGAKPMDVGRLYDADAYRPNERGLRGLPLFLI
jgi:ATP-dependent phosphofructokinase / diphosphate-dependent phosphofructokinase